MKRSWNGRRIQGGATPARLDERELLVPLDLVLNTEALVEVDQVRAATEQYVLAVVHDFTRCRMFVRRSSTAKIRLALEECDFVPGICQRAPRGKTKKSAADKTNKNKQLPSYAMVDDSCVTHDNLFRN